MIKEHWEKRFKKRLELSRSKEEDYGDGGKEDGIPNVNFHRMAELCRILKVDTTKPEGVAQFYIVSKLDRMCNLLRDGRTPNNEGVEDTLADVQNYIDILQDILHGKRGYWYRTAPPQSPEDILQEGKESQVDISSDEFIGNVSMGTASIPNLTLPKEVENDGDRSNCCRDCGGAQDDGWGVVSR